MEPVPALSREQLALLDRLASEELGLPSIVLMENAGRGAAEHVLGLLADRRSRGLRARRVAILCGPGNNGGDGCVVARHLALAGVAVDVLATHGLEELHGDAAVVRRAMERMGIAVQDVSTAESLARAEPLLELADVVVDALLGTGFRGEVRPRIAGPIEAIARARVRGASVVALDLPSGLDADSGIPATPTVVADLTVTFAAPKTGFASPQARACLGRVVVASIGCPPDLLDRPSSGRG